MRGNIGAFGQNLSLTYTQVILPSDVSPHIQTKQNQWFKPCCIHARIAGLTSSRILKKIPLLSHTHTETQPHGSPSTGQAQLGSRNVCLDLK